MKIVNIEVEGTTPLLQHRFPEETLFGLLGTKTKQIETIGDSTPREIADKHSYKAKDGSYYIPVEQFVGAFKHCAGDYKASNKGRKTLKGVAASIFRPAQETASILDEKNNPVTTFEVDVRKATNHLKGAVAVCRPRFDKWKAKFKIAIDDDLIDTKMALQIFQDAGKKSGIGSFRVSRGGYFGQFCVTKWDESKEK